MSNTIKTIIRHLIVVLMFPTKINDFITYAKGIYKAMNGNSNFPNSPPKIATLNADILALDGYETNLHTKPPTCTVAMRDAAMALVKADLRALRNDVQTVVDLQPKQAEVIAKSAGMNVKAISIHQKRVNDAKNGSVSGTIILTAEGGGAHEWQMSKDQNAITYLPATTGAKTKATNLTVGDILYFRNRPILPQGQEGDWCAWIKVKVQ